MSVVPYPFLFVGFGLYIELFHILTLTLQNSYENMVET